MFNLRHFAAGVAVCLAATLSGLADRPPIVPSSATLMSEGNGNRVSFRPTEFGRVYVTDETDGKILYQGEVQTGDTVDVNAREDRVIVAGRTVLDKPLDDGHQFRIYFEPVTPERVVKYRVVEEPVR